MAPVLLRVAPRVAVAQEGGGVPFEDYGADGVKAPGLDRCAGKCGQRSAGHWLKSLAAVVERLEAERMSMWTLDCGVGRVALTLAKPSLGQTGVWVWIRIMRSN